MAAGKKGKGGASDGALVLESVYFAHPVKSRPRPHARAFARVGARRFEFVRLDPGGAVEVYDFPRTWGGVARFLGYAPEATGEKLVELARRAARKAIPSWEEWQGREIEVQ